MPVVKLLSLSPKGLYQPHFHSDSWGPVRLCLKGVLVGDRKPGGKGRDVLLFASYFQSPHLSFFTAAAFESSYMVFPTLSELAS